MGGGEQEIYSGRNPGQNIMNSPVFKYPGHISGFFGPYYDENPLKSGSAGAGISVFGGIECTLSLSNNSVGIEHYHNGVKSNFVNDYIYRFYADIINTAKNDGKGIIIKTSSRLPLSQGFGLSASTYLAVGNAIIDMARRRYGYEHFSSEEIMKRAHIMDVIKHYGLSDVIGEFFGGINIRTLPGLPPYGKIHSYNEIKGKIYVYVLGPPLSSADILKNIDRKTLFKISSDLSLKMHHDVDEINAKRHDSYEIIETFIKYSRLFSNKSKIKMIPEMENILNEFKYTTRIFIGNTIISTEPLGINNEIKTDISA